MQPRDAIEHEVEERLSEALPEVDLLEVVVLGKGDAATLRAVIDHPAGVDHDLCAEVTRVLDRAGLRDRFAVEVWSPGPERPLRTTDHFTRALGQRVTVRVGEGGPDGLPRQVSGTLVAATDMSLTLASDRGVVEVPREAVRRARMARDG